MPTDKGLEIIESLKAKYFPSGYRPKPPSGKDYRFSRKGQMEYKRAARLQALKHREAIS